MFSIARRPGFDEQGARVADTIERLDEMLHGLEWLLGQDPWCFPPVPGTNNLRAALTHGDGWDDPLVRVYYTVEVHKCVLQWIETAP